MATYKALRGVTIQTVDGDPGTIQFGEMWYNSSAKTLKVGQTTAGSWALGGNLPFHYGSNSAFGLQTAAVVCLGDSPGQPTAGTSSAEYDGSSWTAGNAGNTARASACACGTQTAGLGIGGYGPGIPTRVTNIVEEYDGTNWSEEADLNTGRGYLGSAHSGTTTAALAFGGLINPELNPSPFGAVGAKNESEEYNGTAWTEGDNLNTARRDFAGAGTQTAALAIAGDNFPGIIDNVEHYDGSSWTESTDLNTAKWRNMSGGIQTLAFTAGATDQQAICETWDGTSWTEVADLNTGRHEGGGCGTYAAGLVVGGVAITTATEELTGDYAAAATVTSS